MLFTRQTQAGVLPTERMTTLVKTGKFISGP